MSVSMSMSMFMSEIDEGGGVKGQSVFFSILVASYFMWSAALDSSDVLPSYSMITLAQHINTILISTLFQTYKQTHNTYIYIYREKAKPPVEAPPMAHIDEDGKLLLGQLLHTDTPFSEART